MEMSKEKTQSTKADPQPPRLMSLDTLRIWSSTENADGLALAIAREAETIRTFLACDSIPEEDFSLFVKAIGIAANATREMTAIKEIVDLVCRSEFLEKHLTAYVMVSEKSNPDKCFVESMISILESVLQYCPLHTIKCITTIPQLRNVNGFHDWPGIAKILSQLEKRARQIFKSAKDKSNDNTPPSNFLDCSIFPTADDMKQDAKPYLRPAKLEGGYDDAKHYLDVQFRLLRHDFIFPLREGINQFKKDGHKKDFKTQDIRVYRDVHILGVVKRDFIDHLVQFDVSNLRNMKWELSKRLIYGALLCFSKNGFETFAIATVTDRDPDELRRGFVNVNFKTGYEIIFSSTPKDRFTMAEAVPYFESYCHVLEGMKEMIDDLPLQEYIVKCEKTVKPPKYLLQDGGPDNYDLSPLMIETNVPVQVAPLLTTRWPHAKQMTLNESQREAAQLALTKRLAVIQGPPGTGKTYVGLKVVQTLLKNSEKLSTGGTTTRESNPKPILPILLVCYTNHALDQFLEGIIDFCPKGVIRVGGRSSSEKLKRYNLREIQRHKVTIQFIQRAKETCKDALREVAYEIENATEMLESISCGIFSQSMLEKFMKENHIISLRSGSIDSGLSQWLNAKEEDPGLAIKRAIERELTQQILQIRWEIVGCPIKPSMPIENRASIYMHYVGKLTASLQREKKLLKQIEFDPEVQSEIEAIDYTLEISKSQILQDDVIELSMPLKCIEEIVASMGLAPQNELIRAWLGLYEDDHIMIDYIERLRQGTPNFKIDTEETFEIEDDKPDIFVEPEDVSEDYKYQTLKLKDSLTSKLQRMLAMGLDIRTEDEDLGDVGWQAVRAPLGIFQITKLLRRIKPMTEVNEAKVNSVWDLSYNDRFALYKLWVERYKSEIIDQIKYYVTEYKSQEESYRKIIGLETALILRDASVIGMTTTGAAKHRSALQRLGCKIIIIEEAAEVLEAHIVTSLNKHCEHLILIGDHQQLRPNPCVYELAKHFGMEISLFERLVKSQFPHKVLLEQHRMRPEISMIMRHIYPDLQDHPEVSTYDHIRGVAKDIYFIQHEESESTFVDSYSKVNDFEAFYAIALFQYLLHQGYAPGQITILATYAGQVTNIRNIMKQVKGIDHAKCITAVDNFQGEENDIIILSLVRSNEEDNIGFLKVDNRVCVALSRAKKGLYAIGNFKLLSSRSKLWYNIMQTAKVESILGEGLPVVCPNHQDKKQKLMVKASDFHQRPEGGCGVACNTKLTCGHICTRKCHGYDQNHEKYECQKPCPKFCNSGHPCKRKCYEKCGLCRFKVTKTIPECGHDNLLPCHMPPELGDCRQPCEEILGCGHQCSGTCGDCRENGQHVICNASICHTWPCGHQVTVECNMKNSPCPHPCDVQMECGHQCSGNCGQCKEKLQHNVCTEIIDHKWSCGHQVTIKCYKKDLPCPHPCTAVLDCGHNCKGTCSGCLEGKIHQACKKRCNKKLLCGHLCISLCGEPCPPCSKPCPFACRHGSRVERNPQLPPECGHICSPCKYKCERGCDCIKCNKMCSEECYILPCEKRCRRKLNCGHRCRGICGELCLCIECRRIECITEKKNPSGMSLEGATYDGKVQADQHETTVQADSCLKNTEQSIGSEHGENKEKPLVILIPTCYHAFYIEELDNYVTHFDPEGSSYIPCPKCGDPIQKCTRYDHLNKERAAKRLEMKQVLAENYSISSEFITNVLEKSKTMLGNSTFMREFIDLKIDNVRTISRMNALSFQLKLAFVLLQISSPFFFTNDSSELTKTLSTRKSALLKIVKHVTMQQRREFTVDFAQCLWESAIKKITDIRGDACSLYSISGTDLSIVSCKTPDSFLDIFSTGIDTIITDSKKVVLGRATDASDQLTLVETAIGKAIKVLKSKDSELLQDILQGTKDGDWFSTKVMEERKIKRKHQKLYENISPCRSGPSLEQQHSTLREKVVERRNPHWGRIPTNRELKSAQLTVGRTSASAADGKQSQELSKRLRQSLMSKRTSEDSRMLTNLSQLQKMPYCPRMEEGSKAVSWRQRRSDSPGQNNSGKALSWRQRHSDSPGQENGGKALSWRQRRTDSPGQEYSGKALSWRQRRSDSPGQENRGKALSWRQRRSDSPGQANSCEALSWRQRRSDSTGQANSAEALSWRQRRSDSTGQANSGEALSWRQRRSDSPGQENSGTSLALKGMSASTETSKPACTLQQKMSKSLSSKTSGSISARPKIRTMENTRLDNPTFEKLSKSQKGKPSITVSPKSSKHEGPSSRNICPPKYDKRER